MTEQSSATLLFSRRDASDDRKLQEGFVVTCVAYSLRDFPAKTKTELSSFVLPYFYWELLGRVVALLPP